LVMATRGGLRAEVDRGRKKVHARFMQPCHALRAIVERPVSVDDPVTIGGSAAQILCKYRFEASRLTVGQPGMPLSIIAALHQGRPTNIACAGAIAARARQ